MARVQKPIRWWLLFVIIALALISFLIILFLDAGHRQDKVLWTTLVVIITTGLGVLWLLAFSRLAWRLKLITLAAVIGVGALTGVAFRFKGFSGDLIPMFEWRWRGEPTTFRQAIDETSTPTDYPQFLGQHRNGVVTGIQLNRDWDTYPPKLVWRQPIGAGWSGFAVVGDSAITQEQEGDWEKVVCYDLYTGAVKWSHKDSARYNSPPAGLGPRATPTVSENRVYTVGGTGILNCLDFETGDQLWTADTFTQNEGEPPPWGISISPLVFDELVIVSAGGAVAYHKETGEIVWTGHRTQSGYSSPLVTTLLGTEQIVLFNQGLITAHEPRTGELLWKQPWVESYAECVAQPVPISDATLLVSTGYGAGAKLYQLSRNPMGEFDVSIVWETINLKAKFTNIIYYEGYLYGLDDGIFVCINPNDGTRQWKRGRYGHGQTLLISDILLVTTESGDVVLIEPNPERHIEHARFTALTGKTWNTPALAGDYLLLRNSSEAVCYQLPTRNAETDSGTEGSDLPQ